MKAIKLVSGGAVLLVSGVAVIVTAGYLIGAHTESCPWGHKLLTTDACVVLDRPGGRVLIQHRDLENIYNRNNYLEVIDRGRSRLFVTPATLLEVTPNVMLGEGYDAIIVNGKREILYRYTRLTMACTRPASAQLSSLILIAGG
ncbi:MAG TPA: hypothetical protein VGW12_04935 [Pyrinomonadaceae bacterium]|nr:hypothetical protein [Pyrinomonadaceae bacterium]